MYNRYKPRPTALNRRQTVRPGRRAKLESAPARNYSTVDPAVVFEDLLPDLAETKDDFAWACCPFHDDNSPSFSVNLRTGWYRCFSSSCGETGGNIVSFVGALLEIEPADARRHVETHYG